MADPEPIFPIQLLFLISIFPLLYKCQQKLQNIQEPLSVETSYLYQIRRNIPNNDISKNRFIICYFGQDKIGNTGQFRKYLNALSTTVPGAIVVFGVSEFTTVDQSLYNYDLTLQVEKYGNETFSMLSQKYPDAYQYYYNGYRFEFYADYFESHPEVEYAIFSDVDMLILKNPFELMSKNPEEVHFMYDYKPFYRKSDNNYLWATAWNSLNNDVKRSCGIEVLNKSLDDNSILPLIPWNSGLMMGKAKNLLTFCRFFSKAFFCPGMFKNNAEQGLMNHLYLTGQIFTLGIKFHGHHVIDGAFMSCPHSLNVNAFRNRINTHQVYGIHHYQLLKSGYVSACYPELIKFINY